MGGSKQHMHPVLSQLSQLSAVTWIGVAVSRLLLRVCTCGVWLVWLLCTIVGTSAVGPKKMHV